MHPYATKLKAFFAKHADRTQATPMKKYMRDQFDYLGIKTPQSKALLKQFVSENGLPSIEKLDTIMLDLWSLPEREFQYTAMNLLDKFEKKLPEDFITTLEHMIITKSWWDTVDTLASHPVGTHFKRFPAVKKKYLAKWRKSKNMWLRRTAILFQLGYKKETDFDLLSAIIRENLGSNEFFINKAIGWALRQYAYTDGKAVKKFVNETGLHPLSRREAMKHLG